MSSTFYDEKAKKERIAKYAVAFRAVLLLKEGDSILIDAGTSLTPIAKIIKTMADKYNENTHFTIMTHNRGAFDSLIDASPDARLNIFQTGGRYDRDLNASFGHQAESAYEDYHPKWVFIGQSGIDADRGPFCHGNTEELSLKKIIFSKSAFCRVIISDYTKLGIPGGLCFGTSDRLTDNVEHCILLTNDPREELGDPNASESNLTPKEKGEHGDQSDSESDLIPKEKGEHGDQSDSESDLTPKEKVEYFGRYERQVSILSDTHKIFIIPVKYKSSHQEADRYRISLRKVPPPDNGPSWMGIDDPEDSNWMIIREKDDEWIVSEIHIHEYDNSETTLKQT